MKEKSINTSLMAEAVDGDLSHVPAATQSDNTTVHGVIRVCLGTPSTQCAHAYGLLPFASRSRL